MNGWKSRDLIIAIVVLGSAAAAAGTVSLFGLPSAPCAGVSQPRVQLTILANLDGYNNSRGSNGEGPVMSVRTCSLVVLNLVNQDVQAHGLAVEFYAANGIEAGGGSSVNMLFLAYKSGTFRVFCNTLCSVHAFMQHAQLSVTCSPGPGCS